MAANAQKSNTRSPKRRSRAQVRMMVLSLTLLAMVMVALPTVVVLIVGLLPALTWYIVDMTPGRYAFRCIAGFNAAGVVPYLHKLWTGGNDMTVAIEIVADPLAWLVFLCTAALGWTMFQVIPAGVTLVMTLDAKRKINGLQDVQRDLEEEWGRSVAGDVEPDAPRESNSEAHEEAPAG